MSRTIHGKSTAALKHLRECPAALAVYWCYVARMNNEGVAWPSVRGLAHDTGWNPEACLSGRALLVRLGALEAVQGYTRPDWRKLQGRAKSKKVNLDRAEYYRPTGKLVAGENSFSLLYNGGDDTNPIDLDVLPGRTSTAPMFDAADVRPDRTELDSSLQLDSMTQLNSIQPLAPSGAGAENTADKPAVKGKGKTPEGAAEAQAIASIISAWLATSGANGSKVIEPTAYGNKTKRAEAKAMHAEGITPAVVTDYLRHKHADRFWSAKAISWQTMKGEILSYYTRNQALYGTSAPKTEQYDDGPMVPLRRA